MIRSAGITIETTITVFARQFWFLSMSEKFVVAAMELKAGMTFGSMACVMTVVFYCVSFFASKAVRVSAEEPGKFGYDVEMPIMHQ